MPDRIELAVNAEQIQEIQARGKKVAMIGVENAYPIGTDLSRIKEFHERGARYMSLSHNGRIKSPSYCFTFFGKDRK